VLFVIFGREQLVWDQFEPKWQGYLHDQHRLDGLAKPDADRFPRQIPIADATVRTAMIEAAIGERDLLETEQEREQRGAHPFYLDMAINVYVDIEDEGKTPQPSDFGGSHAEVASRFFRHRNYAELATLKALTAPRWFDYALFCDLVNAFQTQYPLTAFTEMTAFSFIEPRSNGRFQMHALMRDALLDACATETLKRLDDFMFERYDALCQSATVKEMNAAHEQALVEAFYHADRSNISSLLDWFYPRNDIFYKAARCAALIPLYENLLALAEQDLGKTDPVVANLLNNLAQLLQDTNRLAEAEPLMRRALAIVANSFVSGHPWILTIGANFVRLLKELIQLEQAEAVSKRLNLENDDTHE
jgi:hypothetical protein